MVGEGEGLSCICNHPKVHLGCFICAHTPSHTRPDIRFSHPKKTNIYLLLLSKCGCVKENWRVKPHELMLTTHKVTVLPEWDWRQFPFRRRNYQ